MNLPLRWCAVTVSEWSSGQCDTIPHSSDPLHFRRMPNWQVALGRWVWTVGYVMCIEEQLEYPAWTTLQTSLRFSQTIHPKMFISLASRPRRHHSLWIYLRKDNQRSSWLTFFPHVHNLHNLYVLVVKMHRVSWLELSVSVAAMALSHVRSVWTACTWQQSWWCSLRRFYL